MGRATGAEEKKKKICQAAAPKEKNVNDQKPKRTRED
jgi:hypothetical protein